MTALEIDVRNPESIRAWLIERARVDAAGAELDGTRLSTASRGQKIRHLQRTGWSPVVVEEPENGAGLALKARRRPAELWCHCGAALSPDRLAEGLLECAVCR